MSLVSFIVPGIFIVLSSILTFLAVRRGKSKKKALLVQILSTIAVSCSCLVIDAKVDAASNSSMSTSMSSAVTDSESESAKAGAFGVGLIAAALAVGLCCIGGGIAIAAAAPAAIAATSEDPKSFGKSMIFVVLGEGFGIYGLLISIMIINQLSKLSL